MFYYLFLFFIKELKFGREGDFVVYYYDFIVIYLGKVLKFFLFIWLNIIRKGGILRYWLISLKYRVINKMLRLKVKFINVYDFYVGKYI